MNRIKLFTAIALAMCFGVACKSNHKSETAIPKIIFDTDMGSDCDDVGALALLHVYADQGKAEILSCNFSSAKIPYGVGIIDAINTYYGRPDIPIGASRNKSIGDPKDKMNAEVLAKQIDLFRHDKIQTLDAEEQTKLNRKILADQEDKSVTYLTVGHTDGLYQLLISKPDDISPLTGKELIQRKIKRWVAMGALNANNTEGRYTQDWNLYKNGTAASTEYLLENFPTPAAFIATGGDVMTGKSLLKTPENNIVRRAYAEWLFTTQKKTLADQRPSWDIIAVMYAVEGLKDYLYEEEQGWLDFDANKGAYWVRGEAEKNHGFILTKENKKREMEDYLNLMIATPPKN